MHRPRLRAFLLCCLLSVLPFSGVIAKPAAEAALDGGKSAMRYGDSPLQTLDFWRAAGATPAPLIVFVHGGGWKMGDKDNATGAPKIAHYLADGYAFATLNYRLVPGASVEQQAADVCAALALLKRDAARLNIDPARIVLMGHSAGAHLVALVGTDPRYLSAAGLSMTDVRGVIALDGAAYDVRRQMADAGPLMRRTYNEAFGIDAFRQQALSPTLQAAAPNVEAFLIVHVDRADGKAQSEAFAAALRQAGTQVELKAVGGTGLRGHMALNRSLGEGDFPATALVDGWLRRRFSVPP